MKYAKTLVPDEFDRRTVASCKAEIIACLNAADVNVILGVEAGSFSTAPPSGITTTSTR